MLDQAKIGALSVAVGRGSASRILYMLLIPVVVFGGLAAWAYLYCGSPQRAWSVARGVALLPDASVKSCGALRPGDAGSVVFVLHNFSRKAVRIGGCDVECGCTVPDNLPMVVSPGQDQHFQVTLHVSPDQRVGPVKFGLTLYTSDALQPKLPLAVTADVLDKLVPDDESHEVARP